MNLPVVYEVRKVTEKFSFELKITAEDENVLQEILEDNFIKQGE